MQSSPPFLLLQPHQVVGSLSSPHLAQRQVWVGPKISFDPTVTICCLLFALALIVTIRERNSNDWNLELNCL